MVQLTLIYPIFQRTEYLRRLLAYLDGRFADADILIADDSPAEQMPQRIAIVNEYRDRLRVTHHICERRMTLIEKISYAAALVKTPFAAVGADDDYFIPSTVRQAVDYLREHHDCSVAHGYSLTFSARDGKMDSVFEYPQRTIDCRLASLRYLEHISNYAPTWYSMHRADNLRTCWAGAAEIKGDIEFGEILPSCVSIIQGKAKKLPGLYMVRQGDAPRHYAFDPFLQWFTGEDWARNYAIFIRTLVGELMRREEIGREDAGYVIEKGFWHKYACRFQDFLVRNEILAGALYQGLRSKEEMVNPSRRTAGIEFLCSLPGLNAIFKNIFAHWSAGKPARLPAGGKIMTDSHVPAVPAAANLLPDLLSSGSPHHADFMPVYESVNARPATGGQDSLK